MVAQADSLWHIGQTYPDSAELAQAYETIGKERNAYADEYAHACYHYGRLLRAKENTVEAMQCFINATHSETHDYHILGRIYSNMGSICHLADEFPLAYEQYERSANYYLQNGDTLLYYYGLNNMAFELAAQGKEEETYVLTQLIEHNCTKTEISVKVLETKAEISLRKQKYDSAIYYVNQLLSAGYSESAGILIKAQAFSYLLCKDSAVYYANQVLDFPCTLHEANNALYILTNDDETKDKNSIRAVAADRADTQKLIEIERSKAAQAAQLLRQDSTRKQDREWPIAVLGTLLLVGCVISAYVYHKRRRHALLSQKIEHLATEYTDLQNNREKQIEQTCSTLYTSKNLQNDLAWKDYDKMCAIVNEHFYLLANKLQQKEILNETEVRLCILVLIGLNRSEIAHTLPYALNSVGKLKDHTAKKLGTTGRNLHDFLLKLAIEG